MTGTVVWFTGRPASGKSTLAQGLARRLRERHMPTCVLDGDDVRGLMRPPPGYDDTSRDDFYATLAALAAHLAEQGIVVLVPATAHRQAYRERARAMAPAYLEIFVDVSAAECQARDPKQLYARAAVGDLADLPGAGVDYEAPTHPDVIATGGRDEQATTRVLSLLLATRPRQ